MTTIYSNNETVNVNPTDDLVLYKEEFINSRIEKFLYAICALDFDDLPTPLSRIEELYKCLATGLPAPTFVPQSRVEKYLMAILGAYDASALPAPKSRTEVLLSKILLGDTDLSDIEWLKSRYEFLLAYIAKGGENDIDKPIYFVNYSLDNGVTTLYNTINYPVKNAVLKGQTLVNLAVDGLTEKILSPNRYADFVSNLYKQSTTYTIVLNVVTLSDTGTIAFHEYDEGTSLTTNIAKINVGINKILFTSSNNVFNLIRLRNPSAATTNLTIKNVMILEGDHTNADIPYFEGMTSVKMPVLTTTGKNLFNKNNIIVDGYIISNGTLVYETGDNRNAADFIEVEPNCIYSISGIKNSAINGGRTHQYVGMYDKNKRFISSTTIYCLSDRATFTTTENTKYIRVSVRNDDINRLQIEKGTTTTYEPHKSNISTCNEEVELRGIGEVRDELNLSTGELTQRIGEFVLDGSSDELWNITTNGSGLKRFMSTVTKTYSNYSEITNWLPTANKSYWSLNENGFYIGANGRSVIVFNTNDSRYNMSITEFKNYLSQNPLIVQYQSIESVKTVDLSTIDQDGKETELSTFDDITHVTVSSEGLVPTGDIDIARPIQFVDYSLDNGVTTLYNTIDYPVKNAILRGQTLVNLVDFENNLFRSTGIVSSKESSKIIFTTATTGKFNLGCNLPSLKNNTKYILKLKAESSLSTDVNFYLLNVTANKYIISSGVITDTIYSFTTDDTAATSQIRLGFQRNTSVGDDTITAEAVIIEYQDGMENWDIPYFEGMASVKMPVLTTYGKNLFDVSRHGSLTPQPTGDIQLNSAEWGKYDVKYLLKPNTQYTLTILGDGTKCWIAISVDGSSQSSNVETSYTKTFSTNSNGEVTIGIYANSDKYVGYSRKSISIEEGTVSTPYEPYKSNILTCNEEVTLRSNGDICDKLNLLTGQLTQRIGEDGVVLSQEVVKTVDLSTVDQDGEETELSTFDDITYVTVSSEELVPTGEITVATKDATDVIDAGIMSLRMDDISNSQTTLEESANAQSDDIDVTMLGVTDIYEQLL